MNASTTFNTKQRIVFYCTLIIIGLFTTRVNAQSVTITPSSASVCIYQCVELTASGASTYQWSPAKGLSGTDGSNVFACPTSTTTYTVTGKSSSGGTSTTTVVVTVDPLPIIVLTAKTPSICIGGSDTIKALGATYYTWSPLTGLSATTGAIVVASPTITTKYKVVGTNANGCVCNDSITIAVGPPIISVPPATICYGSSTVLTASGAISYIWSPATGLSATAGSSVTANPTVTTTYTITGTNAAGCIGTTTTVVTVNPLPIISANSATICDGSSATLTATGATSYTWSPSTNLSVTTGSSVTANPTATTTYTITGTNSNGCTNTTTSVVTVNPLPIISANSATICDGSSTTLTATGATTYTWSPIAGLSATTGSSVTANPTATTTYTITGTNSNGCTNTTTSVVTVNPLPIISANSATICDGSSATLTATGATTYIWSPIAGLSATTGSSVTANPTITTTYTITGTNSNGCTNTTTSVVTVNPLPIISANSATICDGSSATLIATGATSYAWSPVAGLSATTGSLVTANPTITTTYTITGTNINGCTNTTTSVVTVNPLPIISANSATICDGNSATLTASGATSYTWSPSTDLSATTGSSVTANPTVTTTYTITGTNSNGCINMTTSVVTVNPLPTISVSPESVCIGDCATLTASGAISYTWSPGTALSATTGSSVNACPGATTTYTITGTSSNGCTNTTTAVVTVNPLPIIILTATSPSICIGGSDTIRATGATLYTWSPSTGLSATTGATVIANPTVTTKYKVIGINANGCVCNDSITIIVNPLPIVNVNSVTICDGSSATLTATGATSYTWSPSTDLSATTGSSVTANPTSTTTYTITGTNSNGCTNTTTSVVTVNPLPIISANSATICDGSSATLTATGATSYTWSPSTNLSATTGSSVTANPTVTTTYTITGTNSNGCTNTTTSLVTVNPLPIVSANSATICDGSSATLTATGATSYTWSPIAGLSATTGSSVTANPTSTTTYTITGTNSNGCTNTTTSVVTVNPLPIISANSATICDGSSATLTATGATSYTWSPSTDLSATTGSSVTANPTITTTYTITGTNSNGCTNTTTSVVTVNPLPIISANSATICDGSSATLIATGATSYTWSPSTDLSATTGSSVTANPTVTTTYTITGTNSNGCTNTTTSVVTVNPLPIISANSATICDGSSATLTATGATSYTWSPIAGLSATTGSSVTAYPTSTTTYTITGTNSNGCTNTTTATVTVSPKPTIHVPSDTICYGSCATLQASGLNESGTYTWSPSTALNETTGVTVSACPTLTTTYTIIGTNGYGCSDTTTATVTVNPLPIVSANSATICSGSCATLAASGATSYTWNPSTNLSATTGSSVTACPTTTTTYTITGTNVSGCTNTTTSVVTVNPLPVIILTATSPSICIGSSDTIRATGATSYTWSPSTGLSSTTGALVIATPTVTTKYKVIGANANGCVCNDSITIIVNPLPIVNANSATICDGGSATLIAAGATSYTWSPIAGLSATTGSSVTANPTVTTTYTITGTNSNGCTNTTTSVVTVNPLPIISANSATICDGSSATLTATGATSYTWSPIAGLSATTGSSVTANPTITTTYTITGTNSNGCTNTTTSVVTVNPLPIISANSATICDGSSATLTVTGATSYTWSPIAGLSATTGSSVTANPTITTTYTITGTNINGCTNTTTSVVTVNPLPIISANSATICDGSSATLTATGATSYTWSPIAGLSATTGSSVTANPTLTTTYTITGTNSNGCTNTTTSVVTVNPLPIVSANSATICDGSSATLTATGATSYTWSPIAGLSATTGSSVTANPTLTTTYTITGTNSNGCTDTTTSVVTVNPLPIVSANSATICDGSSATLTATGATSYTWSPIAGLSATTGSSVTANPTVTTTYTITGTNVNGCTNTTTSVVIVNPLPIISANSATICRGSNVTLTARGATSYTWSPSTNLSATTGSSVTANPSITTTYTITGTNTSGCTNTTTSIVSVSPVPTINVPSTTVCYGSCVMLQAFGLNESGTYTWSPSTSLNETTGTTVTACPTITTTYTIIGTNQMGCSDTTTAIVTVLPVTTIITPLNNDTVCTGTSVTFTVSATGSNLTYTWQKNDTTIPGQTSNTYNIPSATLSDSGVYSVIVSGNCGTDTSTAILKVNGAPNNETLIVNGTTTNKNYALTLCANSNDPLLITLNINGKNMTFQWQKNGVNINGAITEIFTIPNVNMTDTGIYRVITTDPCGSDTSTTVTLKVNNKPILVSITVNDSTVISKLDSISVCQGSSATFDVAATGDSLTYQWQFNGNNIVGADSPSYVIDSTTSANTGLYDVIVSSACGTDTAYAPLKVNTKPVITKQPRTNIMCAVNGVCGGHTFCVTATGAIGYQWYLNNNPIPGATEACYSFSPGTFADTGKYYVIVSNQCGSVTSDTVIFVLINEPEITSAPSSLSVCPGSSASFCVTATGTDLNYQWQLNGANISGADTTCYTISSVTTSDTGVYDVIVSGVCGADTAYATLRINSISVSISGNTSICTGSADTLTASGATTYTWSPSGSLSASTGAVVVANPTATTTYTVVGTNGSGCVNTTTIVVTILPTTAISLPLKNDTVCAGSSVTFTVGATGSDLTYTWQKNGVTIAGQASATYTILSTTISDSGIYSVIVSGNCGVDTSTATLKINIKPIITIQPRTNIMCAVNGVCGGHTFCVTATGATGYQWYLNNNPIPGATETCYSFSPGTFADTGKYYVIVSNQCGSVTSDTVIFVLINEPEITSAPDSLSVCPGSGASFCVTATGTDLNYQWQLNGANISGADTTCYTISSVATSDTGVYDVIVTGVCGADTAYATLKVHNCAEVNIPTHLEARNITCNTASLSWVSSSALPSFTVEYRVHGNSSWTTKPVTTNSITLTGLSTGTNYEWSVKENNSEYASMADFNTSDICFGTSYGSFGNDGGRCINNLKVYPNPTFSIATITGNFEKESNIEVMITDMSGKVIISENENVTVGDYIHQLDMSKLVAGTYFLVITNGDQMVTEKIEKIE